MLTLDQTLRVAIEQAAGSGERRARSKFDLETAEATQEFAVDAGAWSEAEKTQALEVAGDIARAIMANEPVSAEGLVGLAADRDTSAHQAVLNGLRTWTTELRNALK